MSPNPKLVLAVVEFVRSDKLFESCAYRASAFVVAIPPETEFTQLGALAPLLCKTCPALPLAKNVVAPEPVWYGIWLAAPPAKLVADAAKVALPAVKLAAVPVNPAPLP